MAEQQSNLVALARGVGVLATCIVQELSKSDPTFEERFLRRLTEAHYEFQESSEDDPAFGLSLLTFTRSLITGFDHLNGQRSPFLESRLD